MVLNSHHSLTASTTLASIVSAVILAAVGLCIPYTERGAKHRAAPLSGTGQPSASSQATPAQGPNAPGTADVRPSGSSRSAEPAQP